jgi:hypothetical protein
MSYIIPLKMLYDGGGNAVKLSELETGDVIPESYFETPNNLIAFTELTSSTNALVSYTIGTGNLAAINLNSDTIPRYAKTTFTAPQYGKVSIEMEFDMIIFNSSTVLMIGLHDSATTTNTPAKGCFRINADNDSAGTTSGMSTFYARFILTGLTPGQTYTYYFLAAANYSGCIIRASKQQTTYVSGSDHPAPVRIFVYDLGNIITLSNPAS